VIKRRLNNFKPQWKAQMKQQCSLILIGLLALPHLSGTPVLGARDSQASAPQKMEDAIDAWVRDNHDLALGMVFQDDCTATKDVRWISCVRMVPGHPDELEYALSVEKRYDGTIRAHISRPKAQSVYVQLRKLRKEHPHASVGELSKLVEVESQTGDQRRFPALARLADEFEKIRFSPVLSNELMMDATQYRFRVRLFSGEQMEVILSGPGSGSPHQPQALIQWAESAREMLSSVFH
jgi:hypothetical protein